MISSAVFFVAYSPHQYFILGLLFENTVVVLLILLFGGTVVLEWTIYFLLKCPGCRESLITLEPYCPQCGNAELVRDASWFNPKPAHCLTCGQDAAYNNGKGRGGERLFKIHACSHCGLYLECVDTCGSLA